MNRTEPHGPPVWHANPIAPDLQQALAQEGGEQDAALLVVAMLHKVLNWEHGKQRQNDGVGSAPQKGATKSSQRQQPKWHML